MERRSFIEILGAALGSACIADKVVGKESVPEEKAVEPEPPAKDRADTILKLFSQNGVFDSDLMDKAVLKAMGLASIGYVTIDRAVSQASVVIVRNHTRGREFCFDLYEVVPGVEGFEMLVRARA